MVVQVRDADLDAVRAVFDSEPALRPCVHRIGRVESGDRIRFTRDGQVLHEAPRGALHRAWSETSHRMRRLRDDPGCADEEHAGVDDASERGLWCTPTFDIDDAGGADFDAAAPAGTPVPASQSAVAHHPPGVHGRGSRSSASRG